MSDLNESPGLRLSALDVKSLSHWPDSLVEDYLSLSRTLIQATTIINVTSQTVTEVEATLASVRALYDRLAKQLNNAEESIAITKEPIKLRRQEQRSHGHEEQIAGNEALMALDRANLRKLEHEIPALTAARVMVGM